MSESAPTSSALETARQAYRALHGIYEPLDKQIAQNHPDWNPGEYFCARLASLCEDMALTMLGADRELAEPELQAYNAIFNLSESAESLAVTASWLNESEVMEEEIFERLEAFMLTSHQADSQSGATRTREAMQGFLALAKAIAMVDDYYHPQEDVFYRELARRIDANWDSIQGQGNELLLILKDGTRTNWKP